MPRACRDGRIRRRWCARPVTLACAFLALAWFSRGWPGARSHQHGADLDARCVARLPQPLLRLSPRAGGGGADAADHVCRGAPLGQGDQAPGIDPPHAALGRRERGLALSATTAACPCLRSPSSPAGSRAARRRAIASLRRRSMPTTGTGAERQAGRMRCARRACAEAADTRGGRQRWRLCQGPHGCRSPRTGRTGASNTCCGCASPGRQGRWTTGSCGRWRCRRARGWCASRGALRWTLGLPMNRLFRVARAASLCPLSDLAGNGRAASVPVANAGRGTLQPRSTAIPAAFQARQPPASE